MIGFCILSNLVIQSLAKRSEKSLQ
jgi:hypothetical protein